MSNDVPSVSAGKSAAPNPPTVPGCDDNTKLKEFYARHDVSLDQVFGLNDGEVFCSPYRFIRLNPRYNPLETLILVKVRFAKYRQDSAPGPARLLTSSCSHRPASLVVTLLRPSCQKAVPIPLQFLGWMND